jgi:hypothetical protein
VEAVEPILRPPQDDPAKWPSLALSATVHLLLITALFLGVQWKSTPPSAVEVEVWRAVPAPASQPEPRLEPRPEPKPKPEKPKARTQSRSQNPSRNRTQTRTQTGTKARTQTDSETGSHSGAET